MADVEIADLAALGVITDEPPHQLPPEAWSLAHNVRFRDRGVERLPGYERVFAGDHIVPHFSMPVSTAAQTFWLNFSLTEAEVWDGEDHTDITNAGGPYTATDTRQLNGTILGGVAIFNNGVDVPQYWPEASVAAPLEDLPNWPANTTAKVIRAFGSYLCAYGIVDNGDEYPHMVMWSHPADPGTVPSSWDHTNPAVDAGRQDLSDVNAGIIRDALPLQNQMMIYKEGSIWKQRYIGGRFIFEFNNFSDASGILAPRCVSPTGDGLRHVVALQDDLVVHDGVNMDSILDKRVKKEIFDDIDPENYLNCFMYTNPTHNEVVFCYPQAGSVHPNKAVAWNYKEGGKLGSLATRDITYRNVALGVVEGALPELWSDGSDTWADDTGPWGSVVRRKLVAAGTDAGKHFLLDTGLTRDGVGYEATLQRTGLSIIGRKRTGEWIVNQKAMKMVKRVWPKVIGGPIRVRLGAQQKVDGPVTWTSYASFNAALQDYIDLITTGRLVGVEFSSAESISWRIDGYKIELEKLGDF